jgi:hypothetical protein
LFLNQFLRESRYKIICKLYEEETIFISAEWFLYFVNKVFFVYFVDKMVLTSHKPRDIIFNNDLQNC